MKNKVASLHERGSEGGKNEAKISSEGEREREQKRRGGQLLASKDSTSKGKRWYGRTPLLLREHYISSHEGSLVSKYRTHLLTM